MGTGGQTYVFQTIGAILLLAPYALWYDFHFVVQRTAYHSKCNSRMFAVFIFSLLLLTIPRVRDFIRIRGLFDASTSRKYTAFSFQSPRYCIDSFSLVFSSLLWCAFQE
jgi:hypothetical protein